MFLVCSVCKKAEEVKIEKNMKELKKAAAERENVKTKFQDPALYAENARVQRKIQRLRPRYHCRHERFKQACRHRIYNV